MNVTTRFFEELTKLSEALQIPLPIGIFCAYHVQIIKTNIDRFRYLRSMDNIILLKYLVFQYFVKCRHSCVVHLDQTVSTLEIN